MSSSRTLLRKFRTSFTCIKPRFDPSIILLYIAASVEQYCDITQVNALPENEGILEGLPPAVPVRQDPEGGFMPKELTHILFADALVDDLDQAGRKHLLSMLRRHRPTLHFGSIAADTLFYELTVPLIDRDYAPWGEIIHGGEGEDTGAPIREMLSRLQNHPESGELANNEDDARFVF